MNILGLIVLLGLLLASCSGGASSQTTPPAGEPPTAAGAPAQPIPQTSAGTTTSPTPFLPTQSTQQASSPTVPNPQPSAPVSNPTQGSGPAAGNATSIPDPAGFQWAQVASGLENPIGIANAGDGSGRLFVLEKAGRIRVIKSGNLLPDSFLDITDRVGSSGSEQGLLGLAFDPKYKTNGFFYVNYTDLHGDTAISRFQASADPNRSDPATEKILLQQAQPFPNHNGGEVTFGPDGFLYLGLGDGGSAGDPQGNGQSKNVWLGKILRIDVAHGDPYAIPADNPFAKGGGKPEIWAYGLRNPWRFSFDRKTGDLFIGDVGQDLWEEVDFLPAGSPGGGDFGWNIREGLHPFKGSAPSGTKLVDPVAEYSHADGGCSITGGAVYRGAALPEWQGVYLYGDYCSGIIWGLLHAADGWKNQMIFETSFGITSFGEDEGGELYLADYNGALYRLARK